MLNTEYERSEGNRRECLERSLHHQMQVLRNVQNANDDERVDEVLKLKPMRIDEKNIQEICLGDFITLSKTHRSFGPEFRQLKSKLQEIVPEKEMEEAYIYIRACDPTDQCKDVLRNNITAAIGESNKVILVISDSFVSSNWCQYKADQAVIRSRNSKADNYVNVFLEDCYIPDKIAHLNCVNLLTVTDYRREFDD
ncbi:unnamed protein product [Mytilus coruscus]|uniref:TIR domain-containing protein n=1 Tax=Mytilus coruscus TaxID=42192 RepID=A0A6J8DZH8_MYTCO|nr:unnamed protein product [Mytilus coruscus]